MIGSSKLCGRIFAGALSLAAALSVGGEAKRVSAALLLPSDPQRSDIVVHFSSGSVAIDASGEPGMATIDSGEIRLSTNDISCRPKSDQAGCVYTLVNFFFHTAPFSVGGKSMPTMQVQLPRPVFGRFLSPEGMRITVPTSLDVTGIFDGGAIFTTVSPDLANPIILNLNLDTQQLTMSGDLSGASGTFHLTLGVMATGDSPFVNLPPNANAGPDQSVSTACFASVTLDKSKTTDPNGDLRSTFFTETGHSLGDGTKRVSMFPGHHHVTLVAADAQGAESTDDALITVTDNGSIPTVAGAQKLTFQTPPTVTADQVVLGASGTLTLSDRVIVRPATGAPTPVVVNMGQTSTEFGADSVTTAQVWSRAPVFLRERAKIIGTLQTVTTPQTQNGTSVSGGTNAHAVFTPANTAGYNQLVPSSTTQVAGLEPGQSATFVPGNYSQLTVKSSATATLQSGTYFFGSFDLEPQGTILLSGTSPVFVYTNSSIIFRGAVSTGANVPPFVLVNLGTAPVTVEAPFTGTILAPNSLIQLASSGSTLHRGAFFGANINVAAGAIVEYLPFSFDFARSARSTCALTPTLQCVEPLGTGGFRAHFSYSNQVPFEGTVVPIGPFNRFSPGPENRGQPVSFLAGLLASSGAGAFTADFTTPSLTWTLGAQSVTATGGTTRCH